MGTEVPTGAAWGTGLCCHAGFLVGLHLGTQSGRWLFWSHSVRFPFPASFRGDGTSRYLPSTIGARRLPNSQPSSVDSVQTFVHSRGPVPRGPSLVTPSPPAGPSAPSAEGGGEPRQLQCSLLGTRGTDSEVAPRLWWEAHLQAGSSLPTHPLAPLAITI